MNDLLTAVLEEATLRPPFAAEGQPPYLQHAIAPGTPLANSVRLKMHGEIRLKRWKPFRAEELLHVSRGFSFRARVGAFLSGSDSLIGGKGAMSWNWLGRFPVAGAEGDHVTRSAIGRWILESIWLPTMLLPERGARWLDRSVTISRLGETGTLQLTLGADGRLGEVWMRRWGDPGGSPPGYYPFGGVAEEERTFEGYRIPSRLRVGWRLGARFREDDESFRVTIDEAIFH